MSKPPAWNWILRPLAGALVGSTSLLFWDPEDHPPPSGFFDDVRALGLFLVSVSALTFALEALTRAGWVVHRRENGSVVPRSSQNPPYLLSLAGPFLGLAGIVVAIRWRNANLALVIGVAMVFVGIFLCLVVKGQAQDQLWHRAPQDDGIFERVRQRNDP